MIRQSQQTANREIYRLSLDGRGRFVIYNASAIGNPPGLLAGKWYFCPYPIPLGLDFGEAFATAAEAEQAARSFTD